MHIFFAWIGPTYEHLQLYKRLCRNQILPLLIQKNVVREMNDFDQIKVDPPRQIKNSNPLARLKFFWKGFLPKTEASFG